MIIEKLIIENFRQFHGVQEIVFARGKNKNVTLIHAENGFGKTALLNALLWGFYGHDGLTDDLPKRERVIHEGVAMAAKDKRTIVARVTILFEDDDDRFTLVRALTLDQQEDDPRKTTLQLDVNHEGQTYEEQRPQWKIDAIMPQGISPFLFFNGERIDHLAMEKNADTITDAIYQMLGLQLLKRTLDDVESQNVRGKLVTELRENTDEDTKELIDELAALEKQLEELRQRLSACRGNQSATADEIKLIDSRLAANRQARDLQSQRAHLEGEETEAKTRLAELSNRLAQLIAEDGYTLFAEELVTKGKTITQLLRQEGKIPARVLNTFIEDLLRAGKCMCGNELKEGCEAYDCVKQLLTIAGDQHFNNAVGSLDNAIGVIEGAIVRTRETFKSLAAERVDTKHRLHCMKETLDEISQKLGGKDSEEVHKLEEKRQNLQLRQRELDREQGSQERDIAAKDAAREQLRRQIASSRQQAEAAARAQRRLEMLDETHVLLEKILDFEMQDLRDILAEEINKHFKKIIDRDYWVELNKDFILRLRKRVDYEEASRELDVAHSQGQRQVTSLVFIASLVALASRRQEIPTILKGVEGGNYPMVMDSPFGQLGDEFRSGVARWIPGLAPQVVIMVSSSQYRGEVERELDESRRVGRRYMLCYHGPAKRKEAATRISIGGKSYVQYREGRIEFTEVKEID